MNENTKILATAFLMTLKRIEDNHILLRSTTRSIFGRVDPHDIGYETARVKLSIRPETLTIFKALQIACAHEVNRHVVSEFE